jgi:hypothetical protein
MYYSVILLRIMVQLVVVWGLLSYIACLCYIVIKMPVMVLLSCLDAWCVVNDRVTVPNSLRNLTCSSPPQSTVHCHELLLVC